jgi:hypothetical protein
MISVKEKLGCLWLEWPDHFQIGISDSNTPRRPFRVSGTNIGEALSGLSAHRLYAFRLNK